MIQATSLADRLRSLFAPPHSNAVEIVDELLNLSQAESLHIECRAERCTIHALETPAAAPIDVPFPAALFRAVLARFNALCDAHSSPGISPYGGAGIIRRPADPSSEFHIAFINTPVEQSLDLSSVLSPLGRSAVRETHRDPPLP